MWWYSAAAIPKLPRTSKLRPARKYASAYNRATARSRRTASASRSGGRVQELVLGPERDQASSFRMSVALESLSIAIWLSEDSLETRRASPAAGYVSTVIHSSQTGFLAIAEQGIGDALTLLPCLRALRASRPDLRIELLTPGLFPLADNLLDTATVLDHRPLAGLGDEGRLAWLRERNVQWAWNTEREQGPWGRALGTSGRPTWVTAPSQRAWGSRHVLRVRFEQLRALFPDLRAPGEIGLALTAAQQAARRAFRGEFPPEAVLVAIQAGAGDPKRVWPAEKFRAVASALAERPQVTVLVFLSDNEPLFRAPGYLPDRANLRCVSEPLPGAVPKLAACDLCIGNDSGFYHLAFALGSRVVGIHRSVRGARRWAYRSPRSRAVCCWMPRQLQPDWTRWVSVRRVLRAARKLAPGL